MAARVLTAGEQEILRGLGPHTLQHARYLLAAHPGLRLTSGRRSPERNRAVGGVASSYHLVGRAVDLGGGRATLAAASRTARAQRVGTRCTGPEEVINEGDHLHVAW